MMKMEVKKTTFLPTLLVLIGIFLVTLTSARLIKHGCPILCTCNQTDIGIVVHCHSGLMKELPKIYVNATQIYAQHNLIEKIQNDAFITAGNDIKVLNFGHNKIRIIDNDAFAGMENTLSLSLANNKLTGIQKETLSPLLKLYTLQLSDNDIVNFDSLCVLQNLKTFDLETNSLTSAKFHPCFNATHNLQYINLGKNDIQNIVRDDFYSLRNISVLELYCNSCKLKSIKNDTFMYLQSLRKLGLKLNYLTFLPTDAFKWQRYLHMLDLSYNKFQVLPQESLRSLTGLNELYLGGNKHIKNFTLGPVFRNLQQLGRLGLNGQNLSHLANDTFQYLDRCPIYEIMLIECSIRTVEPNAFVPISKHLQNLNLNSNPITAATLSSAFYGLRNVSFRHLILNGLLLEDLDQSTFENLKNTEYLTRLSLASSMTTIIRKNVFVVFKKLTKLSLRGSKMKTIEYGGFDHLPFVESLDLSSNRLDDFPSVKKGQLPSYLKILKLNHNNIVTIFPESFEGLDNLTVLLFQYANVKNLGVGCWESLTSLEYLDLSHNDLGTLNSFQGNLPSTLKTLVLTGNNIQLYDKADFSNIHNLQHLDLSNQNKRVPNMTLILKRLIKPLFRLQSLDIGSLALSNFDVEMFQNNTELEFLVLTNNRFQTWDPKIFEPLKKLNFLTMAKNDIYYINKESFRYLISLQKIDLSRNLFRCDCNLEWFRNVFIYKDNIFIENLQNGNEYMCTAPVGMKHKSVLDFHITRSECLATTRLKLVMTILSAFVGVTIVVSAVIRYRWYIRYWIYLLRVRRKQYHELNIADNFLYDAFVAYNSDDRKWVLQELLPALEYNDEFKLCLYDRDWVVGANIIDCVMESIENSRKTILILSDNFAKSEWCQFELTLAHHKLLNDKIDILVPILLSDIQPRYMSAGLRALLTQKIYIEWPQEKNKEEQFWKGLKAALKKKQRRD